MIFEGIKRLSQGSGQLRSAVVARIRVHAMVCSSKRFEVDWRGQERLAHAFTFHVASVTTSGKETSAAFLKGMKEPAG